MCECQKLPECNADPVYNDPNFNFQGIEKNTQYFDSVALQNWEMEWDVRSTYLKCEECGQYWYIDEYAPEQSTFPLFAIKYSGPGNEPTSKLVREKREMLSFLAHDGLEGEICRKSGCKNRKLKGREFCIKHISFP